MKTQTSKRSVWVKIFILIPLTTLLLLSFSTTEIRYKEVTNSIPENEKLVATPFKFPYLLEDSEFLDTYKEQRGASKAQFSKYNELAKKYNAQPIATRTIPLGDLKILESIYKKMSPAQKDRAVAFPECLPKKVISQDGASRKLMAEYNKLAKHYNNMSQQRMRIKMKDVERLEYIYSLMSEKQKADAEPYPDFPPMPDPPPPPPSPQLAATPNTQVEGQLAPTPPLAPKIVQGELSAVTPASPASETPVLAGATVVPPPPPPPPPSSPPDPLDHIISLAKRDAIFYYRNKKINADKAISVIKENKDLSISVMTKNDDRPVVKISKNL